MAINDLNNIAKPPLQNAVIGQDGKISRPWAIWFRDIYQRIGYQGAGGNPLDVLVKINQSLAGLPDTQDSGVKVEVPDIATAPPEYDQSYMQTIADLTNENKKSINQLAEDLNNAIQGFNKLLKEIRNQE